MRTRFDVFSYNQNIYGSRINVNYSFYHLLSYTHKKRTKHINEPHIKRTNILLINFIRYTSPTSAHNPKTPQTPTQNKNQQTCFTSRTRRPVKLSSLLTTLEKTWFTTRPRTLWKRCTPISMNRGGWGTKLLTSRSSMDPR